MSNIQLKGYVVIIVTNQYLINDGIITNLQYLEFTKKLIQILKDNDIDILDIFYCPHSKDENCNCYKPNTGLIDMAIRKYPDIELDNSFIVGDSTCDVELGNKLGIKSFGINVDTEKFKYIKIKSLLDLMKYI